MRGQSIKKAQILSNSASSAAAIQLVREFNDINELCEAARGWDLDFYQLGTGRFRGRVAQHVEPGLQFAIQAGDGAEVVFARVPGRVFAGKVKLVMEATGTAQLAPSGELPILTGAPSGGRYPIRIVLNDPGTDALIPQGAGGTVAVYTRSGKPVHIITKVVMRMQAWLGYLTGPAG